MFQCKGSQQKTSSYDGTDVEALLRLNTGKVIFSGKYCYVLQTKDVVPGPIMTVLGTTGSI